MENTKTPFRVMRGKKENILKNINDGFLYFTTDTHQIYLGTNNAEAKEILMGYETGIFYGLKDIPVDGSGNMPDPEVIFVSNEIEGNRLPNIKDLILNKDGCFYRVIALIDDFTIKTTRLTLQGSGVGPGVGPGGANFSITILNGLNKTFAIDSENIPIDFISYHSDVTAGMENRENYIQQVTFSFLNETEPFYSLNTDLEFNKNQSIDLYNFKHLFSDQKKTIRITIYDAFNNSRYIDFQIQLVDLTLKMTQNNILYTKSKQYTYSCNISGATSGVSEKYLVYEFWREHDSTTTEPILRIKQGLDISTNGNTTPQLVNLSELEHGIYNLKITAYAKISNSNTIIPSNILNHKMINYVIQGSPLLTIIPTQEFMQYTETPLKYLLVTEDSNKDYSLKITLNNQVIDTINIKSNTIGEYPGIYFDQIGLFTLYFWSVFFG